MKRNFLNKIILLAVLLAVVAGCKTRKAAVSNPPAAAGIPSAGNSSTAKTEILRNISSGQFDFNTLSIKAKAGLSLNNNSNNVGMTIRMRKDEAIWISVTAIAGLEVARVLITPDSIKIRNRLQGTYIKKPFSYIYQFANRNLDFKALQALLIGNALPGTLNDTSEVEIAGDQSRLSGNMGELGYTLFFNTENKLTENSLKDRQTGKNLQANYSDFQDVSGKKIPLNIQLRSNADNKPVLVDLKYNTVTVNEAVDLPFSIPKGLQ